tara:strand:- start:2123 stop:2302 length:180 start_codon:yes stop_codon:yes gene_type:complete
MEKVSIKIPVSNSISPRIKQLSPKTLDYNIKNKCYAPLIIPSRNTPKKIEKLPNFKLEF